MDNWVKESSLANLLWFSSFLKLTPLFHYFSNLVSLCWPFEVSRKNKLYNQRGSPPSKKMGFINSCLKYLKIIYKQNFFSFRWNVKCTCLLLKKYIQAAHRSRRQQTLARESYSQRLKVLWKFYIFSTNEFTVIFFLSFFFFSFCKVAAS